MVNACIHCDVSCIHPEQKGDAEKIGPTKFVYCLSYKSFPNDTEVQQCTHFDVGRNFFYLSSFLCMTFGLLAQFLPLLSLFCPLFCTFCFIPNCYSKNCPLLPKGAAQTYDNMPLLCLWNGCWNQWNGCYFEPKLSAITLNSSCSFQWHVCSSCVWLVI